MSKDLPLSQNIKEMINVITLFVNDFMVANYIITLIINAHLKYIPNLSDLY